MFFRQFEFQSFALNCTDHFPQTRCLPSDCIGVRHPGTVAFHTLASSRSRTRWSVGSSTTHDPHRGHIIDSREGLIAGTSYAKKTSRSTMRHAGAPSPDITANCTTTNWRLILRFSGHCLSFFWNRTMHEDRSSVTSGRKQQEDHLKRPCIIVGQFQLSLLGVFAGRAAGKTCAMDSADSRDQPGLSYGQIRLLRGDELATGLPRRGHFTYIYAY